MIKRQTKHNYSEAIYYATKEEEVEARHLRIKDYYMGYPQSVGVAPGSTNQVASDQDLKEYSERISKVIVKWSDIKWRYIKHNIKIKLTPENKAAVFEKMKEYGTMNCTTKECNNRKFNELHQIGTAYLFYHSGHHTEEANRYVGWSYDYMSEPDYYDRYKYTEVSEKEFLGSDWILPATKRKATIHKSLHDKMCDKMNISPQSNHDAVKNMHRIYTKKQNKKGTEMKETTVVEVKVNGTTVCTADNTEKTAVAKTDLELAEKWITKWYNSEEDHITTTYDSPKEAKKKLQRPEFLGYTTVTYKKAASATTDIPVVELKV